MLFFSVILSYNLMAQLEVKEGSFKEVEGFVNINTDIMFDDNDKPYAVLKVKTENINDKERRQLLFQGDARTFIECEYKVGEVWLYISYYATYLKISHPDFGSTEFWFPFDMQGKKGYELTLFNKPSVDEEFMKRLEALENATAAGLNTGEYGYVVIKTTPVNGATVLIDGEEMEMKTPFVSDKLGIGHHRIRVIKDNYKPYVTVVEIEEGKTINLDVNLDQEFGNLEIVTQPKNVNIKLNRIDKGLTPQTFNNIPVGNYRIELNKKKYQAVVKDVVIKDGETTYVDVELDKTLPEKSLRAKGWTLRPEIGIGFVQQSKSYWISGYDYYSHVQITDYYDSEYLSFNINTGYQFNKYVFLGVGVGADLKALSMMSMPIYLNPRFYMHDRIVSLFFDIRLGWSVNLKSSKCYFSNNKNKVDNSETKFDGLMGEFEIGLEYGHSDFGLAIGAQNFHSSITSNRYKQFNFSWDEEEWAYYTPLNYIPIYVVVKYGYNIFLNKK